MDLAFAVATPLKEVGIVVAALLSAVAVLAGVSRVRALAMVGAVVLTPVLLVAQIWNTPQLRPVRDRPAVAAAAVVAGLVVVAVVAMAFHRRPTLFPLGAVLVLPFRVPIELGGQTANLLVPLYLVVAAGALAFAVPRLRGSPSAQDECPRGTLEYLLLGLVVLYAVQATYSSDFTKALEQVVFFYVPFALLYALLVSVKWTARLVARCLYVLVGLALVFSAVGFGEYATRTVFLNPNVIASNQFQSYFRVNSLFFDPNIFGRFLAVAMIALVTVMLWSARRRVVWVAGAMLLVLWGGLVLTLSQSSLAALLVGLVVLAALRWSARWTFTAVGAIAILSAAFVVAFPGAVHVKLSSNKSLDKATSGRGDLVKGGLQLFADRPVYGWGAGSFSKEYRRQRGTSSQRAVDASHTIPVTIAAEQGAIGLIIYVALLLAAFVRMLPGARASPVRAGIAAAFAALVVHTLAYAAFLEDPLSWTLLGIAMALAWRGIPTAEPTAPDRDQATVPVASPAAGT